MRLCAGAGRRSQPILSLRPPWEQPGGPEPPALSGRRAQKPSPHPGENDRRSGGDLLGPVPGCSRRLGSATQHESSGRRRLQGCRQISPQRISSESWTRRRRSSGRASLSPAARCPLNEDSPRAPGVDPQSLAPRRRPRSHHSPVTGTAQPARSPLLQRPWSGRPFVCRRHGQPAGFRLL